MTTIKREDDLTGMPELFVAYIQRIDPESRGSAYEVEVNAYIEMKKQIEEEKNSFIKKFMEDTILFLYTQDMLFSYFLEARWQEDIKIQRASLKGHESLDVFYEIESIIAQASSSYGYTKTHTSNRYPLNVPGNHSGSSKTNWVSKVDFSPNQFLRSYYKFGVHTFHVGQTIVDILECLEDRYGLDFKKLEKNLQKTVEPNIKD